MSISERLRELRASKSITQRELASQLNISSSSIAMYETGQRMPDADVLELFADYFNVTVDYLLGRTDNSLNLDEEPTRQDLEEFLRTSNVQFDGTPLDDNDKEELIDVLKFIWGKFNKEKKTPNE
ncbi:MAG: helix-turn-helix domain-containing protein [Bacillota bacterium]